MSYILDALRKAETERAMTRVSSIAAPPVKDASRGRDSTRRILLVVIAMACAMALTWWWTRHTITAQAQASPLVSPAEQVVAQRSGMLPRREDGGASVAMPNPMPNTRSTPRPARVSPSMVETEGPVTLEAAVSTLGNETKGNETKPKSATAAVNSVVPSPSVAPEVEGAMEERLAMMTSEVEPGEPPAPAVQAPVPDSSPAPAAPSVQAPSARDQATAEEPEEDMDLPPLLRTLPYRFQSTLPKMVINAQAYAEEADARFVIINMKKYREGDHTEADIVVERIAESYLVMRYQGQVFRLQR